MKQKCKLLVYLFLMLVFKTGIAGALKIDGSSADYYLDTKYYEVFTDSSSSLDFSDIQHQTFSPFSESVCDNEDYYYWLKFYLDIDTLDSEKWVLEIYEHHIDDFTCYIPWQGNSYKKIVTGDTKKFKEREYKHVNFVFDLHNNYVRGRPVYYKIKSTTKLWDVSTHIRTNQYFTYYAVNEYFLLGLFYGILFIMGVYNLLFYFSTREQVYIYYSLYIVAFALYCMLEDGVGFAYVWSNKPGFTDVFSSTTRLLILLSYTIYSVSFLRLRKHFPKLYRIVIYTLSVYFINFLSEKIFGFYNSFTYFLPFLIIYIIGIYTYIKEYKPARFFVLGSTFVVLSIFVMLSRDVGYTTNIAAVNIVLVYATNIGITLEILILSIALGDRIRYLKQQQVLAQERVIEQLKENQKLKDKVNLELEDKVRERTKELETKNKNIYDSLNYALRIQKAVLPTESAITEMFPRHFILHLPKDIVSGDFYWFYRKDQLIYVAAVDCTGHGVPGAFMSIMGSNLLHFSIQEMGLKNPATILDHMNFELKKRIHSGHDMEGQHGMDISLCVINTDTHLLKYAGAFNPVAIISDGTLEVLTANRFPLGRSFYNQHDQLFETRTLQLHKSDKIYLFSDGFKDQFGGATGERYTANRFYELLIRSHKLSMEDQKAFIENELYQWKADKAQIDDILILGLEI